MTCQVCGEELVFKGESYDMLPHPHTCKNECYMYYYQGMGDETICIDGEFFAFDHPNCEAAEKIWQEQNEKFLLAVERVKEKRKISE